MAFTNNTPKMKNYFGLLLVALLPILAWADLKQVMSYPTMCDRGQLAFNGGVTKQGKEILVTGFSRLESGTMFVSTPVDVARGFKTQFSFSVQNGQDHGGDGFAFIVQAEQRNVIRANGGGIGYDTLRNALVVEFDTFKNSENQDPDNNHIALHYSTPGGMVSALESLNDFRYFSLSNVRLADGNAHVATITYNSDAATLTVSLDNGRAEKQWGNVTLERIMNLIDGRSAFVGFSASTGGNFESHHINSWQFWNMESKCTDGFTGDMCEVDTSETQGSCEKLTDCDQCSKAVGCCGWCSKNSKCVSMSGTSSGCSGDIDYVCKRTNPLIYWGIGIVCFVVVLSGLALFIYWRRSRVRKYTMDPSLDPDQKSESAYMQL